MRNLFAYGTLMCEDIMLEVSGCQLTPVPGTLKNYSRRKVKGEQYPAIMPHKHSDVKGVVYQNVTDSGWERLDAFEGEMYARQSVQIELDERTILSAETYVVRSEFLEHLEQTEWHFDEFLRTGKTEFQEHYQGYACIEV